jgi:hypothetical protein
MDANEAGGWGAGFLLARKGRGWYGLSRVAATDAIFDITVSKKTRSIEGNLRETAGGAYGRTRQMVLSDAESGRSRSYSGGTWRRVSLGPLEAGGWAKNADHGTVAAGVRELRECGGAIPAAGRCRRPGTGGGHTCPLGCLDRGRGSNDEFILRFCAFRDGGIALSARGFRGGDRGACAHSPRPGLNTGGAPWLRGWPALPFLRTF